MIIVKVELHPQGAHKGEAPTLMGLMLVENDGTGSEERGNYTATLMKGGPRLGITRGAPIWKVTRVEGFPRKSAPAWELVRRALVEALK